MSYGALVALALLWWCSAASGFSPRTLPPRLPRSALSPVNAIAQADTGASVNNCFVTSKEMHGESFASMGSVPSDLMGTFYCIGPANFDVGEVAVKNPYLGDGMLSAVTFDKEGRVTFRNRFVNTPARLKEAKEGKMEGANRPVSMMAGWAAQFVDPTVNRANRGLLFWGKRLVALWDSTNPWKVDPKNLETYFPEDFGEWLRPAAKGGEAFSSPVAEASSGRLITFGRSKVTGKVRIREWNDKMICGIVRTEPVPLVKPSGPGTPTTILPDFAVTKSNYIFSVPTLSFDKIPFNLRLKELDQALAQSPQDPSVIWMVPRDGKKKPTVVEVDPHLCWSMPNAFEDDAGATQILMVRMDPLRVGEGGATAYEKLGSDYSGQVQERKLMQYTVMGDGYASKALSDRHVDHVMVAPSVKGQSSKFVYCGVGSDPSGASPIQGVCRLDIETGEEECWMADSQLFIGALSFAPKAGADPSETDGYVTCIALNAAKLTSEILVFDAAKISLGPVCRLDVGTNVPPATAAGWTPRAKWSPENIDKAFKLADLYRRKGWNSANSEWDGLGLRIGTEEWW
ncbi:unnamed protein product [Chrysoparadoxa australica]